MTRLGKEWGSGPLPKAGNPDAVSVHFERLLETAQRRDDTAAIAFAEKAEEQAGPLLEAMFGNSPYLGHCLVIDPSFTRLLVEEGPDAGFAVALEDASDRSGLGTESKQALMKRLRIAKRRASLAIAAADIASVWPLEKVTAAITDLACATLGASCRHLLREMHDRGRLDLPDPDSPEDGSGLIVLGMGKLGARELNYSSDIDLIILFDEEAVPHVGDGSLQQNFTRFARNLVSLMDERTADGYVFRTDLRLRPDPGSTAPALSTNAAEIYYESAGQNWERAAMIKALPVSGDIERGHVFLENLAPFIWRRNLDFAAIQDIQSIKRQINAHRGGGEIGIEGHNIKLGRGGIREIEFFAQTQQLIWGGRDKSLRERGTLATLDGLVAAGHTPASTAAELKVAYEFCRTLEHRLQMIDDRQTHSLPEDNPGLARVAVFSGFSSTDAFTAELLRHLQTVERHYAGLFENQPDLSGPGNLVFTGGEHDPSTLATLEAMGYGEPERVSSILRAWHTGRYAAMRSTRARELLTELVPTILETFSESPDPDSAMLHFDRFLARLPAGVPLFSMFTARPALFQLISLIIGSAPRLADWLSRHPGLLDSVLAREFTDLEIPDSDEPDEFDDMARKGLVRLFYVREFGPEQMRQDLETSLAKAEDLQDLLDVERRWSNDRIFQIGVQMLRGFLPPVEAGPPLSNIADVCISHLLPVVAEEFAEVHGSVPGGRIALIAFGKLGSREMTVSSDLDLLFVYDHDREAIQSDGRKALSPTHYYAQLCRRLVTAITAPGADGRLYEVDMRLRPSGNAGPLASSLEAFEKYQRTDAWLWEHQALTRARVICAENGLDGELDEIIGSVLGMARDPLELVAGVNDMRERIWREHGSDDIWSIKHMRGGLVDVEFIAQYLQLAHASEYPEILARDPISVFQSAHSAGLIEENQASDLIRAAQLWRNLQGILRLTIGDDYTEEKATPGLRVVVERASGVEGFNVLEETMRDLAVRVAELFQSIVGEPEPGNQ